MLDPATLASLPFFDGVPPRAMRELAARAVERRYATGERLFTAGMPARGLFVLVQGRVRVVRDAGDRRLVVHVEDPGGTMGEVPLFDGGGYPATAEAVEPSVCVVLSRESLQAAVAAEPALAWVLLARLARRVRGLVERVDAMAARSVISRLAALLLARAASARGDICTLGSTQRLAAEELGTVREVLVRSLRELREAGIIASAGAGRYRILDRDALARLAAGGPA